MDQTIRKTNKRTPKKRRQKRERDVLVLSQKRGELGIFGTVIGMLGRAIVPFVGVFGLLLFIFDAFMLEIPAWQPALFSAVFTLIFSVCSLGLIPCAASLGVSALGLGIAALVIGKSPQFYMIWAYNSVVTFINGIMERLNLVGYRSMGALKLKDLPGIAQNTLIDVDLTGKYLACACALLALLFSLLMVSCSVRRVRLVPIIGICGAVMVVIFTYNISVTNWGFALILTALAGLLALKIYDSTFNRPHPYAEAASLPSDKHTKKPKFTDCARGGFAGAFALMLAAVIVLPTAANTKENWMLIDPINDKLSYIRAVVSSVIIGDVPNLGDLGYLGNMDTLNSRTTETSDRTFTGEVMLEVQSAYNTPVYLRSWVGTYYRDDSWYSAMTSDVEQYHDRLYGKDFSPEDITYNILSAVDPTLVSLNNMTGYVGHTDLGYITMCIDVENVNSSGNLLFIPSMMNPEVGLLEPGTQDASVKYDGPWTDYHEGIVTSSWFNFDKKYRTVSLVPSYRNTEFDEEVDKLASYYDLMTRYIFMNKDLYDTAKIKELVEFVNKAADKIGYDYYEPSLIERYFAMTPAERDDFIHDHYTIYKSYKNYVDEFYLWLPQSESLDIVTDEIFPGSRMIVESDGTVTTVRSGLYDIYFDPVTGVPLSTTHDKVMRVIDYLAENYTYSLTPIEPSSRRLSALDAFLTDTKQGYCVQFATAATMLLRNIGVPARYVEGYIASEFMRNSDPEKLGNYIAEVCDYDAHAWIEVWVDGFGWMQYEVTPSYYDSMYKPLSSTSASHSSSGSITHEEEYLEEEETIESETVVVEVIELGMFVPLFVIVPVIVVGGVVVYIILRVHDNAKKRREKRHEVIHLAKASPDNEDSQKIAKALTGFIMQTLALGGIVPEDGELPSEFAQRCDTELSMPKSKKKKKSKAKKKGLDIEALTAQPDTLIADIMPTMQKAQFSGGSMVITHRELDDLCRAHDDTVKLVCAQLSPIKKYWLRKVRGLI